MGGKEPGRRDWTVVDGNGMTLALFEALCLDSVRVAKIDEHVEKVATRYDPVGLAQGFVVVYANVNEREAFWAKYLAHVRHFPLPGFEVSDDSATDLCAELPRNLRACRIAYAKDAMPYIMYHIVAFLESEPIAASQP